MNFKSKNWYLVFTFLLILGGSNAFAQFFVSSKVCVSENQNDPATGQVLTGCSQATSFFDTDTSSVSWRWDFGTGAGLVPGPRNPQIGYQTPGNYNVVLESTSRTGLVTSKSRNITVGTYPNQPKFNDKIEADTTVCDGSKVKLNPYKLSLPGGNYEYLWFPGGETTQTIEVDTSGCYSVEVKDKITGCSRIASIKVKFCLQDPGGGSPIEKWYLNDGSIMEFSEVPGDLIPRDSLNAEGEITNTVEYERGSYQGQILSKKHSLNTNGATASVFDPQSNSLFFTDGNQVFSAKDDEIIKMADGSPFVGLNGGQTNAVFIVPKTSCNECAHHQYYLFAVDPKTKILSYSILDMRYDNKRGAVVEANIPVLYPVTEQIEVKPTADASGFIIYAHEPNNSNFKITSVDTLGVTSVDQSIGSLSTNLSGNSFAISSDGNMLAQGVVQGGQNFVEVFMLDPLGSRIGPSMLIDLKIPSPPSVFGITFSPDNGFIYATISGNPSLGQRSYLLQIPLILGNATDISNGIEVIASSITEKYGMVQTGPIKGQGEKYVYMSIEGKDYLPYIQEPDVRGNASVVGYTDVPNSTNIGVRLQGANGLGLTKVLEAAEQQEGEGFTANYTGNCFKAPSVLSTQGVCSPMRNEVTWEFEDGTTKKGESVSYTFPKLGWNKIKVRLKIFNKSIVEKFVNNKIVKELTETECEEKVFDGEIYIKPSVEIKLPEKLYICVVEGEKKKIGPAPIGGTTFTYNWQTSLGTTVSSDSAYEFFAPASYKLEVNNNFDCPTTGKMLALEGCEPVVFVPEAITPNGDSLNDDLKVIPEYITDFNLNIYNRWGQLVFNSVNPEIKWDGRMNGKIYSNQAYPYVIRYRSKYFPERGELSLRGTVWVLK